MSNLEACNRKCEMAQYCQNVLEMVAPTELEYDLALSEGVQSFVQSQFEQLGMNPSEAAEATMGLRDSARATVARKYRTRSVANRFLMAAKVECPGKQVSRHGLLGTVTVVACGMQGTPEYEAAEEMRQRAVGVTEIEP